MASCEAPEGEDMAGKSGVGGKTEGGAQVEKALGMVVGHDRASCREEALEAFLER